MTQIRRIRTGPAAAGSLLHEIVLLPSHRHHCAVHNATQSLAISTQSVVEILKESLSGRFVLPKLSSALGMKNRMSKRGMCSHDWYFHLYLQVFLLRPSDGNNFRIKSYTNTNPFILTILVFKLTKIGPLYSSSPHVKYRAVHLPQTIHSILVVDSDWYEPKTSIWSSQRSACSLSWVMSP